MSKVLSQDLKGNAAMTGIQTGNVLNRRPQSHHTNYNSSLWKHNSNLCPNLLTHSRLVPSILRLGSMGYVCYVLQQNQTHLQGVISTNFSRAKGDPIPYRGLQTCPYLIIKPFTRMQDFSSYCTVHVYSLVTSRRYLCIKQNNEESVYKKENLIKEW